MRLPPDRNQRLDVRRRARNYIRLAEIPPEDRMFCRSHHSRGSAQKSGNFRLETFEMSAYPKMAPWRLTRAAG
jgi:hypothetical protein